MCDNDNNNDSLKLIEKQQFDTTCAPCINDPIGCNVASIRHVMANNLSVLNCFKNMKCAFLAYINAVSLEFVQQIDHEQENLERTRFNVLVESLIAGIHQALKSHTNGQIEPFFQLWIQDLAESYDIGNGWIDGSIASGCYDANGDATNDTYDTCTSPNVWNGTDTDLKYSAGNLPKLYPNKISIFANCNKNNAIQGDEILYHYNPTIQLLYNGSKSSLYLKWGDANYNYDASRGNLGYRRSCLFPLLSNENSFKSTVYNIVPPSPVVDGGADIWDDQQSAYNFIRNDVLLQNKDLKTIISQIDIIVRRCELTHQTLKLKLKMSESSVAINNFDSTTNYTE